MSNTKSSAKGLSNFWSTIYNSDVQPGRRIYINYKKILREDNYFVPLCIFTSCLKNVTRFAKRVLSVHAIIHKYLYQFEILNVVYLKNAWWVFHAILHQSR